MTTVRVAGGEAVLWPAAVPWDGGRADALGRVRYDDAAGAARLLAAAIEQGGAPWLLGPLDGDTWHSYRLAVDGDGRRPFTLEPPADPVLQAALTDAGFAPVLTYVSTAVPLPTPRAARLGAPSLRVRAFRPADAEAELTRMHRLAHGAFARAPLFTPIAFDDFAALYRPTLPRVVPELVLFAEDVSGETVGVLFGLPDFAEGERPRTAILKTYAASRPGAGALLAAAFHTAAEKFGFTRAIHALMHDDNASLRHSQLLGGDVFRHYALFGRRHAP